MALVVADYTRDTHFSRLMHGEIEQVDLAAVALEIARDEFPELQVDCWLARLDVMGRQVRERISPEDGPEALIEQLNHFLFAEEGYRGNTENYYDPRNSFLNEVLERKLGIPITLSLVYLALAERVGLAMRGVGMPAHFIVKLMGSEREIFVDPFHAGAILTRDDCEQRVSQVVGLPVTLNVDQLEPSSNDQVVLRLLGNLKVIYLEQTDLVRALRVQERICAVHPLDATELRDLGLLYLRTNRPGPAIEQFQQYCRRSPEAEDLETVRTLLKVAVRLMATMN